MLWRRLAVRRVLAWRRGRGLLIVASLLLGWILSRRRILALRVLALRRILALALGRVLSLRRGVLAVTLGRRRLCATVSVRWSAMTEDGGVDGRP